MYLPKVTITFDEGEPIVVQCTSRDLLAMETDDVNLSEMKPIVGTYTMAWYALRRLERTGRLAEGVEVPATVAAFLDLADIDNSDEDPEGNDLGQVPTPG